MKFRAKLFWDYCLFRRAHVHWGWEQGLRGLEMRYFPLDSPVMGKTTFLFLSKPPLIEQRSRFR